MRALPALVTGLLLALAVVGGCDSASDDGPSRAENAHTVASAGFKAFETVSRGGLDEDCLEDVVLASDLSDAGVARLATMRVSGNLPDLHFRRVGDSGDTRLDAADRRAFTSVLGDMVRTCITTSLDVATSSEDGAG